MRYCSFFAIILTALWGLSAKASLKTLTCHDLVTAAGWTTKTGEWTDAYTLRYSYEKNAVGFFEGNSESPSGGIAVIDQALVGTPVAVAFNEANDHFYVLNQEGVIFFTTYERLFVGSTDKSEPQMRRWVDFRKILPKVKAGGVTGDLRIDGFSLVPGSEGRQVSVIFNAAGTPGRYQGSGTFDIVDAVWVSFHVEVVKIPKPGDALAL